MGKISKPSDTPAWRWIVGGIALAAVGMIVAWFLLSSDVPSTSRGAGWFLLVPGGIAVTIYGLFVAWRQRSRRRR